MKISVIGAGGHVGYPFTLTLAENPSNIVTGIDLNPYFVDDLNLGSVPYLEEGASELVQKIMKQGNLKFSVDYDSLKDADTIVVMIGTPIDEEQNPRLDDLFDLFTQKIIPNLLVRDSLLEEPLIVLRSTVAPGTTEKINKLLETFGCKSHLVYIPERVQQGKSIEESKTLPTLVGTCSNLLRGDVHSKAERFICSFNSNRNISWLEPTEAELAKLFTNMYRYVNFALANEFMIVADKYGADAHKILEKASLDYPRLPTLKPGPNVGGPCLFKDGRYLMQYTPFVGLVETANRINEGMPAYIMESVRKYIGKSSQPKVLILGAAFKPESDDTRFSLSFKMAKILKQERLEFTIYDPYIRGYSGEPNWSEYDIVILMTPHTRFRSLKEKFAPGAKVFDYWHFYGLGNIWRKNG